ncbi:hypothetical protein GCM10007380_27600 [Gottfriedia solisilvae]|uniref:Uncharacterized protein n=1 Tax=Gottfriedia solisilvae TaxID=1516104 RepID=A0A8J3ASG1_9BACI|nr:hypothetical protein GCM10007380_27600 [Gottfriedia solisilvae]
MDNFIQTATYEHSFWLQVLRDHSQFILDGLAEKEKEEIQLRLLNMHFKNYSTV